MMKCNIGKLAGIVLCGVLSFNLAFSTEAASPLILVYLACMCSLAWLPTGRGAFYVGFLIGLANMSLQLWFFVGLFGAGACALWAILALWHGLFALTAQRCVRRWQWGAWLVPVLWLGFEYFRSELYYLRFSWLAPGMAFSGGSWVQFSGLGYFGISAAVALAFVAVRVLGRKGRVIAAVAVCSIIVLGVNSGTARGPWEGPKVAGLQLEYAAEATIIRGLNMLLAKHPEAEVVVLGEYTFETAIPQSVYEWCRTNRRYLVVGGKERHSEEPNDFDNVVLVIAPNGSVVHRQVKMVPIQFFADGRAAQEQKLWESPWGPIGIAICYDLSYTRVIDPLIREGAKALIVPTLDAEHWGEREHELHARVAPVRAREYEVSIFRVATSGISQLVTPNGRVAASAPFPGPCKTLAGTLAMNTSPSLPLDRYLGLPCAAVSLVLLPFFFLFRRRQMLRSEAV